MGFRTGYYAKVWEIKPMSPTATSLRISTSRKNKETGQYEQDFSGYVLAVGANTASAASALPVGARIKLGDVDVTTKYDKVKNIKYTNFTVFGFTCEDNAASGQSNATTSAKSEDPIQQASYEGETPEDQLPF